MAKDLGNTKNPRFLQDNRLPPELAIIIGMLEVVGGTLLIVGLLTRIASFLFAIEMIGAFIILNITNKIPLPIGYETDLLSIPIVLMAISISSC